MLKNVTFQKDRMLVDDLVFRYEWGKDDATWELGDDCFMFYKGPWTVRQYDHFFRRQPGLAVHNVFELGIWDGGSTAFWFEWLRPRKLAAVDIMDRADSPYFQRFVESRGLHDRLKTYWGTDQEDVTTLLDICRKEFDGPLDLVLDDASHMYAPTRTSFELLFPLLRPGGLYIIEDWNWAFLPQFHTAEQDSWVGGDMNRLVLEMAEATGSSQVFVPDDSETDPCLIDSMAIYPHFAVLERGTLPAEELGTFLGTFTLDARISRRPAPEPAARARAQ